MGIAILTPPAFEPVSLAAAKLHLRVDHDAEDSLIGSLVRVAREAVEAFTGRVLIARRVRETRDAWAPDADGAVRLALAPVTAIVAVRVVRADGSMAALSETPRLARDAGLIRLASFPAPAFPLAGIEIDYDAGFGDTEAACPAPLRQAVLVTVAALYEGREGEAATPPAALALAAPFARVKL